MASTESVPVVVVGVVGGVVVFLFLVSWCVLVGCVLGGGGVGGFVDVLCSCVFRMRVLGWNIEYSLFWVREASDLGGSALPRQLWLVRWCQR